MADKFSALDTDVLLQSEAGERICGEAHRVLREAGFIFRASPTVIRSLERHRRRTESVSGAWAENILTNPKRLDLVLDGFDDTQRHVTSIHVNRAIERGILQENQRGDGLALVEAAYLDCVLFVTTRPVVLEKRESLTLWLIQDCGMQTMFIFHPKEIVTFFRTSGMIS